MQEPAPKRITPEEKIAGALNQMGHPSTPQTVSPDHSSVLNGAGEVLNDAGDFIGTTLEELGGGATHVRHASGKKPLSLIWEKAKRLARLNSKEAA